MSHLTRGAWIEIPNVYLPSMVSEGRTSHEVRGLKFAAQFIMKSQYMSHLTRGAWIEIPMLYDDYT